MIRFIIMLIFLGVAGATGFIIQHVPYYVLIKTPGDQPAAIKMSVITAILLALVISWIVLKVLKFLFLLWRSPKILSRSSQERKKAKAMRLLRSGLAELIAGHYGRAERDLEYGGRLAESVGQDAVIFYENAAIAANRLQATERRDFYLLRARQDANKQQTRLTRLAEAELLVNNREFKKAAKMLEKLHEEEPRNYKISVLLDDTYRQLDDWAKAWELLPSLRTQLNGKEYGERKKSYAISMIKSASNQRDFAALEAAWKKVPSDLRRDKDLILHYAVSLAENEHPADAEKLLVTEIKNSQDLELIQAYSQLRHANFEAQLENMIAWESKHEGDAIFLYAKALIAFKAKDLDTALHAIEAAIKRQPSPEAFTLYAQILEARNQPEAALRAYSQSALPAHPAAADLLPAPVVGEGDGDDSEAKESADKS